MWKKIKKAVISSSELNPTIYFSYLGERAKDIKESGKAVVYVGKNFIYGIAADESLINFEALTNAVKKNDSDKVKVVKKNAVGVIECQVEKEEKSKVLSVQSHKGS